MNLPDDISERLATIYGLAPGLYGGAGLEDAISLRKKDLGLDCVNRYFDILRESGTELAELVDRLLVPESWFFRDGVPFVHLKNWVNKVWIEGGEINRRPLRVLSLPCSVGQEAWSLAITLMEAGLGPGQFSILAGDLSQRFLNQAKEGVYRRIAFRGNDFCDRHRYFEDMGDGCMRVRDFLRELVTFRRLNLLEPHTYQAFGPYDVIFCRNVLIYFDDDGRKQAVDGLARCLHAEGLFFVGHADSIHRITGDFVRVSVPGAFCYGRRRTTPEQKIKATITSDNAMLKRRPRYLPEGALVSKGGQETLHAATSKVEASSAMSLLRAQEFANEGKLAEAESLCRELLAKNPADAEALFLLGEVMLSSKKIPESEAQFRRVVYLKPKHTDALFRLAMLAEQRGDYREATTWRRRAFRETKPEDVVINHE